MHPIELSPDNSMLAVANLPGARLELFDTGESGFQPLDSIPVGLDPVTVRFRHASEVWVVCHISDAINIVDLNTGRVERIIPTKDGPCDVVFAGNPERAYVSCAFENTVQVFDPVTHALLENIVVKGERPRAMGVSPDGSKVYVAVFESGNASTILAPRFGLNFVPGSAVDLHDGPYGGKNPPPNLGNDFEPALSDHLSEPPPRGGLIVKKDAHGRWLDDQQTDWTEYVSGAKAPLSGRPVGWDMPDRDLAIIDTVTHELGYVSGLMNICMDVAVNPVTGRVSVVGTDAKNEVRFEPNLNGRFLSVELSQIDPSSLDVQRTNLNPHLRDNEPTLPLSERQLSVGEPRQAIWTPDGETLIIAGMGSDNLLKVDISGNRISEIPVPVQGGPSGLAVDTENHRLFVFRRFDSKVSVLDMDTDELLSEMSWYDPTPESIRKGRPFLYNTQLTSGTGHTSCASCHVDGRFDRLSWDLGSPEGRMTPIDETISFAGRLVPDEVHPFHPMKGPMMTMTLQDIIGHEPFHWRGDRFGIEAFNPTFTDLQGTAEELTYQDMADFKAFLATIHFPPNRYRTFRNELSTTVPLQDHFALGRQRDGLSKGQSFEVGNARAGLLQFLRTGACTECHTQSTGLGPHMIFEDGQWVDNPKGPMDEQHVALIQQPRANDLPFKIASLRGLAEKVGADFTGMESRVGFGFAHDGAVDSLTRFIQDGFNFIDDKATADLIALLLSFTGGEISMGRSTEELNPPGLFNQDTHAAVGKQFLLEAGKPVPAELDLALAMTGHPTDPVDLIAYQKRNSQSVWWLFDPNTKTFHSDGPGQSLNLSLLLEKPLPLGPILITVVPPSSGKRMALDWDGDGFLNRDERLGGFDPYSNKSTPVNQAPIIEALGPLTLQPGEVIQIDLKVEDMNDPPDPIDLSVEHASDFGVLLEGKTLTLKAPDFAHDEPSWIEIEAQDQGNPPMDQRVRFPVFVMDSLEAPVLKSTNIGDQHIQLVWRVEPGMSCQVLYAEDIQYPVWLPLTPPRLALGPEFEAQDRLRGVRPRFYRIVQLKNGSRR